MNLELLEGDFNSRACLSSPNSHGTSPFVLCCFLLASLGGFLPLFFFFGGVGEDLFTFCGSRPDM